MEGLSEMSEKEFADWLRSVPREKSPQAAQAAEEKRDQERGPYVPHHHHAYYAEARH